VGHEDDLGGWGCAAGSLLPLWLEARWLESLTIGDDLPGMSGAEQLPSPNPLQTLLIWAKDGKNGNVRDKFRSPTQQQSQRKQQRPSLLVAINLHTQSAMARVV
jgi:hypothetical protein